MKAILVDDEISNLKGLRLKLEKLFVEIEILGCYQKPEDAIKAINKVQPDILFLDIRMPRINGFELLSQLKDVNFQVIFITAYNEYAIEAFKKNAVDYVLKPIDDDDLTIAVNKAKKNIEKSEEHQKNINLVTILSENITENNKLIIPTQKGISFIEMKDILYLEGYKGYTKIHTETKETLLSSYSLVKFEKQLNKQFFKCHKSYIVNLSYIRHYENEGYLILTDTTRIPISQPNKKIFMSLIQSK